MSDVESSEISKHLLLCNLFTRSRKFDKAEDLFKQLCSYDKFSGDFRPRFNYAQMCITLGRFHDAECILSDTLSMKNIDIAVFSTLSGIHLKLRNPSSAVEICKKGLAIDVNNRECMYNINIALRQLDKIYEAIALSWKVTFAEVVDLPAYRMTDLGLNRSHRFSMPSIVKIAKNYSSSRPIVFAFICVKYGTKYNADYVNNLYQGIKKYGKEVCKVKDGDNVEKDIYNHNCDELNDGFIDDPLFICFTDDSCGLLEEIEVINFEDLGR